MGERQWRAFNDCCDDCGDEAEVYTTTGCDNLAHDGDDARCVGCGRRGVVCVDEDDTAHIIWSDYVPE